MLLANPALPFNCSTILPAPAVTPATTPQPPASAPTRSAGDSPGSITPPPAQKISTARCSANSSQPTSRTSRMKRHSRLGGQNCNSRPRDYLNPNARPELPLIHNGHRSFRDTASMTQLTQLTQLKRIKLEPILLASSLRCCLVVFRSGTPDCCAGC